MLKVIFLKVIGKMILLMDMEGIRVMKQNIKDLGKKINNMDMEKKNGLMEMYMKVIM